MCVPVWGYYKPTSTHTQSTLISLLLQKTIPFENLWSAPIGGASATFALPVPLEVVDKDTANILNLKLHQKNPHTKPYMVNIPVKNLRQERTLPKKVMEYTISHIYPFSGLLSLFYICSCPFGCYSTFFQQELFVLLHVHIVQFGDALKCSCTFTLFLAVKKHKYGLITKCNCTWRLMRLS